MVCLSIREHQHYCLRDVPHIDGHESKPAVSILAIVEKS